MIRSITLWALVFCGSGCLHTSTTSPIRTAQTAQEQRKDFLLWGLVPLQNFEGTPCPNGIGRVDTVMSAPNWLFTTITLGLYWGVTVQVWCADMGAVGPVEVPSQPPPVLYRVQ